MKKYSNVRVVNVDLSDTYESLLFNID